MNKKIISGFTNYLTKRGYVLKDIIERDSYKPVIVFEDDEQLVFADCRLGVENKPLSRLEVVPIALKWLRETNEIPKERLIRFDSLAVEMVNDKYGFIEHHINRTMLEDDDNA